VPDRILVLQKAVRAATVVVAVAVLVPQIQVALAEMAWQSFAFTFED